MTSIDDAAAQALRQFGFSERDVEGIHRMPLGIKNLNYLVRARSQDWVLKCHQGAGAADRLQLSHLLEQRLADADFPLARLQRDVLGNTIVETEAGAFTLHTYVRGQQISMDQRDGAHLRRPSLADELGSMLGELHHLGGAVPQVAVVPDTGELLARLNRGSRQRSRTTLRLRLRRSRSDFESWILKRLPDVHQDAAALASRSVVATVKPDFVLAHNDLNWENLIFDSQLELLGVIDFDNATPLPRALDVGAGAAVLIGPDEARLEQFLAAYARASGVVVDDDAVLVGMRWKCVRSILWSVDAYLGGRVADTGLVAAWCRHLDDCLRALPVALGSEHR